MESHRWQDIANGKRQEVARGGGYEMLVCSAEEGVPAETKAQIAVDLPRTFCGLPSWCQPLEEADVKADNRGPTVAATEARPTAAVAEAQLGRILRAFEWRNANAQVSGLGCSYTQGMGFLAAFCLAALAHFDEELAFLLFARLVEDVLGLAYFCEWPPMLAYHADAAVLQDIVPKACPELLRSLGKTGLHDVVSMLSVRVLITCFVTSGLQEQSLRALWTELLSQATEERKSSDSRGDEVFPRHALLAWFVGVVHSLEPCMLEAAAEEGLDPGERAAFAFHAACNGMADLQPIWRPQLDLLPSGSAIARMVHVTQNRLEEECEGHDVSDRFGIPHELTQRLHTEFLSLPRRDEAGIDEVTLRKVLLKVAPDYVEQAAVLFALLDRDGSGSLDFLELMAGVIALREGKWARKLELLFRLYDTDGSGTLEVDELCCLGLTLAKLGTQRRRSSSSTKAAAAAMAALAAEAVEVEEHRLSEGPRHSVPVHLRRRTSACFRTEREEAAQLRRRLLMMDADCDGRLSLEEWTAGAMADPGIKKLLACIGIRGSSFCHDGTTEPGFDANSSVRGGASQEARDWDMVRLASRTVSDPPAGATSRRGRAEGLLFRRRRHSQPTARPAPGSPVREDPVVGSLCARAVDLFGRRRQRQRLEDDDGNSPPRVRSTSCQLL